MVHAGVFIVTLVPPTVRRTAERFPSGGGLIKLLYRGPSHLLSHQGSHSLNQPRSITWRCFIWRHTMKRPQTARLSKKKSPEQANVPAAIFLTLHDLHQTLGDDALKSVLQALQQR